MKSVLHLPDTTSTNDAAKKWAQEGAPDGAVVIADHQTAGRGRLGRTWHSPPGVIQKVFKRAGLELVETYKPFAKESEPYQWVNETRIAPWVIYVLRKSKKIN